VVSVPLGHKQHSMLFLGRENTKPLALHAAKGHSLRIFKSRVPESDCFTAVRNDDKKNSKINTLLIQSLFLKICY
jgi:hypothetical protein